LSASAKIVAPPDSYVLDSFALMALLRGRAGRARVEAVLHAAQAGEATALMSAVNAGEVLYLIEREHGPAMAEQLAGDFRRLGIEVVEAAWPRVVRAARLKAAFPMSYADTFAAELAQERDATLLTGDPEFRAVQHLIAIEWLPH
jgi:predicted nucleic acid-binding protein